MTDRIVHQCPDCGADAPRAMADGETFECLICKKRFKVMVERETGKHALIEVDAREAPEPLLMPRGSIRALVTVVMAACCWVLVVLGRPVPGYLLSLLATTIGYYFGFRKKARAAHSRIFDPSTKPEEPLSLPTGFIRFFLIAGFVLCGGVLLYRRQLADMPYLEFFVVLFGLIVGYVFAKILADHKGGTFFAVFNHVRGAAVLAGTAYLAFLFVTGTHTGATYVALVLSSLISFYFGSRS